MEAWIGLIGALLGSVIGGAVTYVVTRQQHQHETKSEQRRRRMDAFEAIHLLLSESSGQTNMLNMLIIGDVGYGAKIDASKLQKSVQSERLQMLVDFYAPFLSDDIKAMNKQLEVVVTAVTEVVLKREKNDQWVQDTVVSATAATRQFGQLADQAKSKLANRCALEVAGG